MEYVTAIAQTIITHSDIDRRLGIVCGFGPRICMLSAKHLGLHQWPMHRSGTSRWIHGEKYLTLFLQVAFWTYVDAVNILTDLIITGVTLEILIHLQMPLGTKAMVVGVFGSRIL
jgi:hypothetical protein